MWRLERNVGTVRSGQALNCPELCIAPSDMLNIVCDRTDTRIQVAVTMEWRRETRQRDKTCDSVQHCSSHYIRMTS